ncbi:MULTISPECIES: MbcA/ParS/Xre antitoxin family protein [Enterobacterales]|jgi:uncharacterized protein (DUF2384 family)|uniref:MbcA/ParS/Xre antitoxin family protein n=1 Tax=Enterobacterales TaxID=91347 RepID=UPI001D046318|nr:MULTISPECIES: MbcA/ParS/Xre antitoxin family protein [Enterobacterales]
MTSKDLHLKAVALFEGNQEATLRWCNAPNRALGWKTPAETIGTEEGRLMVASLILRIEHGVYS